jgi:molybdate transport system substrate-binding protein
MTRIGTFALAVALLPTCGCNPTTDDRSTITIFAAASATDAIDELADQFTDNTDVVVRCNVAASSTLARQIEQGAPADVFLCADAEWMDYLEQRDLVRPASRRDVASNQLVVIATSSQPYDDLPALLGTSGRLAIADPGHVPAGRYAKCRLQELGWWNTVRDRLIPALDVRAALRLVEMGEADVGIVYATDARASQDVTVLGLLPGCDQDPIHYPAALCRAASEPAEAFLEFLSAPQARAILVQHGFIPPGAGR